MTINSTGSTHINHQICLSPASEFRDKRNRRINVSNHEFDDFNPDLQEYLNCTNTKQSRESLIEWIKNEKPIAAITMVFNCAINHKDSIDLLNRFYDQLCRYEFGRTYKKRNQLISMFAFLENAVKDKSKQRYLRHEDCNHFHLIYCDPKNILDNFESIQIDIESARKVANSNFRKAQKAETSQSIFVPQIARCNVLKYFNLGDDGLEHYDTKNTEDYRRDHDLKFDQFAYPSIDGFIFGEKIYQ